MQDAQYWPKRHIKAFLRAIPSDDFRIWDLFCDLKSFYSAPRVVNSFRGDDRLHGNIRFLIERAREVASDPRTRRCVGFGIQPEIVHLNTLFFELAAHLAWNPSLKFDEFLLDFCERRYGPESSKAMLDCWRKVVEACYGRDDFGEAHYPAEDVRPLLRPVWATKRAKAVRLLREALEIALKEAPRRAENPLYNRDIVDIARQYISWLFNHHAGRAWLALYDREPEVLRREAEVLRALLRAQARIAGSCPSYRIKPLLDRIREKWGKGLERVVRDAGMIFAMTEWLIDYQGRDFYNSFVTTTGRGSRYGFRTWQRGLSRKGDRWTGRS